MSKFNSTNKVVQVESRTFVTTDIRSHAIFDRAGHSCSHQMTTPDIRAHIKWPPGHSCSHQIWYEHECPGWSFDVSTNVRGGHSMWARMSGVVIWCEHECPALSKIAWERMSVGTNVRTPFQRCLRKNVDARRTAEKMGHNSSAWTLCAQVS